MPRNNELLKSCLSASTLNPGLQRAERHDGHSHDQPAPARFELPLGFYHENSQWGLTSMVLHGKERFGAGAKTFRVHVWKPRSWALEKRRFGSQFWSRKGGQTAALSDMAGHHCLPSSPVKPLAYKSNANQDQGSNWQVCWLDMVAEPVWCGDADQHRLLPVETRLQATNSIPARSSPWPTQNLISDC